MGKWSVELRRKPTTLHLEMAGSFTADELAEVQRAHNFIIENLKDEPYAVYCDLRTMKALTQDCTPYMEAMKRFSKARPNFRGSAVLVDSSVIAMQHSRTSTRGGVASNELITTSLAAAMKHLSTKMSSF